MLYLFECMDSGGGHLVKEACMPMQAHAAEGMNPEEGAGALRRLAFKTVFVPRGGIQKTQTTEVVTTEYLQLRNGTAGTEEGGGYESRGQKRKTEDSMDSEGMSARRSLRPRRSARLAQYQEFVSDESSDAPLSDSMYSATASENCGDSQDSILESSIDGMRYARYDDESSDDEGIIIDECYRQIAYVDAFKRVKMKAMAGVKMIAPCIISDQNGLLPQDSEDASSLTMSLSNNEDENNKRDEEVTGQRFPEQQSVIDTLAKSVEHVMVDKKAARRTRPTVSPSSGEGDTQNVLWYKGYAIEYGMACIHAHALKGFSHPDPVYKSTAPRWNIPTWSNSMLPHFTGEDNVRKTIQYLHYAARRAGMLLDPPLETQKTLAKQYQALEDMLENITSLHRRLLSETMPTSETRITRKVQKRAQPAAFSPLIFSPRRSLDAKILSHAQPSRFSLNHTSIVQGDPGASTDVRWGACFQADIPPCIKNLKRPGSWAAREQRLGGTFIVGPGTISPVPQSGMDLATYKSLSYEDRQEAILSQSKKLVASCGPFADMLGLTKMGAFSKNLLDTDQQMAYREGIRKYGRDFPLIQRDFLPDISCGDMAAYYYDVWKTRSVPSAREFYEDLHQANEHEAREEDTKMAPGNADECASQTRHLIIDSIMWAKSGAQNPAAAKFGKGTQAKRLERALSCLHKKR